MSTSTTAKKLPAGLFAGFNHIAIAIGFCFVQILLFYAAIGLRLMPPTAAGIWTFIAWGCQVYGAVFDDLKAKELVITFAVTTAIGGLLAIIL